MRSEPKMPVILLSNEQRCILIRLCCGVPFDSLVVTGLQITSQCSAKMKRWCIVKSIQRYSFRRMQRHRRDLARSSSQPSKAGAGVDFELQKRDGLVRMQTTFFRLCSDLCACHEGFCPVHFVVILLFRFFGTHGLYLLFLMLSMYVQALFLVPRFRPIESVFH